MLRKRQPWWLRTISFFILVFLLAGAASGCQGSKSHTAEEPAGSMAGMQMASVEDMPTDVKAAPVAVQQAYQFAAANPDAMQQIPCYCGCGSMGHTSNYSCYISGTDVGGKPTYDTHALGCSICVDITHDTMRLLKQGKKVPEIRSYVDSTYARYGSSNMK